MIGFAGANTQYARSSGSELLTDCVGRKKRRSKQSALGQWGANNAE